MRSRIRALLVASAASACLAPLAAACSSTPSGDGGAPPADAGANDTDATIADASWDHVRVPYDGAAPPGPARVPVQAELGADGARTDVAQLMFAAGEMQISGEPFAQHFAGRNLADYDRTYLPTDQYILDNGGDDPKPITDLFGFSTAVESYEYSKYHMNMVAQQTTAGLSLAVGPVTAKHAGATPVDRLRGREAELITAAGSDVAGYAILPAPANNPLNVLGFQGLWPVFAPYKSFDPSMQPNHEVVKSCTFQGGYGGIPTIGQVTPEYECAYNSLHLPSRDQMEKVLVPAALGLATWKEALWAIDFTGRLHDAGSNPVTAVADADRPNVGKANNLVVATDPPGAAHGTYIGSTPLEGMWGLTMLAEMDNSAEMAVSSLTTADGATLGGFATKLDATKYDYDSPLRWFPAAIGVAEDGATPFPGVASMTIADATSRSEDLAALLLGNAMFFGMTDARNAGIGQRLGLLLTFDGDPFAADDGQADGEETAHDRALALLRVAFVDLDRMHSDAAAKVTLDTATVGGGGAIAHGGGTVTTTSLAHVVIALRQMLLSLNGAITQYGAADPDPGADAKGILNAFPIHPPSGGAPSFSARVRQLFTDDATFVLEHLTLPDGTVMNGATVANGAVTPTSGPATIESQAAALRALVEGFLVTADPRLQERAVAVAKRLLGPQFYAPAARLFRGVEPAPGAPPKDEVHMSPERFAWLQSALRETHKVLAIPGDPLLAREVLEDRVARVNKLFLNGWDDLDGNQQVDTKTECLGARLQLAEQALTGELGRDDVGRSTSDRDQDCVLEVDDAQHGSVLARDVFFHVAPAATK